MSADDDRDLYENSYRSFIEALSVLATEPEEACKRLGNLNVPFETKYDVEAGLYLFNYVACPLDTAQRETIVELVDSLKSIPKELLEFTGDPQRSLERLRHPAWVSPREGAKRLLSMLRPVTEQNELYLWPTGR
jgi:hypothetical protein